MNPPLSSAGFKAPDRPLGASRRDPDPLDRRWAALLEGKSVVDAALAGGGMLTGTQDLLAARSRLQAEISGIDPALAELLAAEGVTDVLINGPQDAWVDRGRGLEPSEELHYASAQAVRALATRMAAAAGQRLDDAMPIADATLPGGLRLHAVLPPLAPGCAVISLRVLSNRHYSMDELVAVGTLAPPLVAVLQALVGRGASVVISGATGSGKTTLLMSLLSLVDPSERIVCIEEVSELQPAHPHVVHLQERRANVQQVGAVDLAELVRAAIRMRPDRLVLGEARGPEIAAVLQALNTGHRGGWVTLHANSAADVPARLIALGSLADMSPQMVSTQAAAALDAVVHLRRSQNAGSGTRRWVAEIGCFRQEGQGDLLCEVALKVSPEGGVQVGQAWPRLAQKLGLDPDRLGRANGSEAISYV